VFTLAGACTVTASTTVSGALLETEFDIEVLAAAAAVLELVPSATSVEQGGSLTFTVTGEDAYGNSAETSAAVLSSSVATDVIDGRTVTFPHASPHTITATLGEVTASVLIEVKVKPGGGGLVSTGADDGTAAMMGAGALALVIAGAALLLARRRSSRAEV
jgi:LPXTG-motif cell wall-anchored protein